MEKRICVILVLFIICSPLTGAQSNRAIRWSALSMGSYAAKSANRIVWGVVGQQLTGTTRMGNLILNAGYLTDTLFRKIVLSTGRSLAIPTTYELFQNYPNPFNPITVVSGQSPVFSRVRIAVYDILGREVAVLMDENREAGGLKVTWDARNYASGVYICRMIAGPYTMSRKMMLTK